MKGFNIKIKEIFSKIIRVKKATSKEDAEDLKSVDFEAHEDKFIIIPTTELEKVKIRLQIYDTLMKYDNEHEREV